MNRVQPPPLVRARVPRLRPRRRARAVISGRAQLAPSRNPYDWLGEGAYFWENNPQRALEFATQLRDKPRQGKRTIRIPAVIGATIIDPGACLNLLDARFLGLLREAYAAVKQYADEAGLPLPANRKPAGSDEALLRDLDCAVINAVHTERASKGLPPFDTVRSAFIEGGELYPGSGFREKNHIQICVRNPRCIKGYFWPLLDEEGADGEGA